MLLPVAAAASVDPDSAMHAYARARLADGDGAPGVAIDSYRVALAGDPASVEIARRSYGQALESGDLALASRAAALLERQGALPRDGTLLMIAEALGRKDWARARIWTDRMKAEVNFGFLAPIVLSWIALGEGAYDPPVIDGGERFSLLANRYMAEHLALQAFAQQNEAGARPDMIRATATTGSDLAAKRLAFAGLLASAGKRDAALAQLPADGAVYALARRDIAAGKRRSFGPPPTPRLGFARLIARLADDIAGDPGGLALGIRLARIASLADPDDALAHIIAVRLLTLGGRAELAVAEAGAVPQASWYRPLMDVELVDALAMAGDEAGALVLAGALASAPGADAGQHVRLGRLLAGQGDFKGAAAEFRAAQAGYDPQAVPWSLLLFEGSALEQGERWDEARAVLERAAKLAPDEPVILNYLGYAQIERRQNVDAALGQIRRASALRPQDAAITDSLGWAHYVTGDVKAAVPVLEQAAAGAPADATINEHLGDALWAAGRRFEARYAWRAAATFAQGDVATRLAAKSKEGMKPEYAAP